MKMYNAEINETWDGIYFYTEEHLSHIVLMAENKNEARRKVLFYLSKLSQTKENEEGKIVPVIREINIITRVRNDIHAYYYAGTG